MRLFVSTLLTVLCVSSVSFAKECVDSQGNDILNQPEVFQNEISKKKACYEAQQLAEACGYGSAIDVQTAGIAQVICEDEMKAAKPSKALVGLLNNMAQACETKYSSLQGSMYRSFHAYCNLKAVSFINNLSQP